MKKTLIIATSPQTRGGITSVVKAYKSTYLWQKWNCVWIATHIDKNIVVKLLYFIRGFLTFLFYLPVTNLVHIHFSEPRSAVRKNIFLSTAKLFNKKTILHFHAFSPDTTLFGKKKQLYSNMFNKADVVIALSGFWKEQISKVVKNSDKIHILYNPCPNIAGLEKLERENIILYAGTLNQRKGYSDLIKAFAMIAIKHPNWKIVFAGNGAIENGKELAKSLNISNQIIFKGWISGKEKEKLFNTASIFCLPSYAEGFPMAVLDAWAYGLPVISTPVGGLPDVLKHGENSMVFEPSDIESLSKNLEELINNHKLREKLSKESLKLSKNQFNIENIANQLDSIYCNLSPTK